MAQRNTAESGSLDPSVTESGAGNTGEQQNSGNQGNSGSGVMSESGNGKAPNPEEKIGLAVFVQRASPNKYVIAMLKNKNAMEVHTSEEWQQIIKEMLNKKV